MSSQFVALVAAVSGCGLLLGVALGKLYPEQIPVRISSGIEPALVRQKGWERILDSCRAVRIELSDPDNPTCIVWNHEGKR